MKRHWRGHVFDRQTRNMLREVDHLVGKHVPIDPTQGSYSTSVGASAGTHAGGGAVDLSGSRLTHDQRELVCFLLRRVGFAAWIRSPEDGPWGWHIHAINKTCRDLSSAARRQLREYRDGGDGLVGDDRDPQRRLGARGYTWREYRAGNKWYRRWRRARK